MSFEAHGLIIGRGDIFNTSTDYSSSINIYKSLYDTLSEITTEGYFPAYLGDNEKTVLIGDILFIQDKNLLTKIYIITSVNPLILSTSDISNPFDQSLNIGDNVNFNSIVSNVMATGILSSTQLNSTSLIIENEYIQTGADTLFSPFPISIEFAGCFNPHHTLTAWLSRFTRGSVGMATIIIPATSGTQVIAYASSSNVNILPIGFRPIVDCGSIQLGKNMVGAIYKTVPIQLKLFTTGRIDVYGGVEDLEIFHTGMTPGWQQMEMTYPVAT